MSASAGVCAIVLVAGVWAGRSPEADRLPVGLTAQAFVRAVASADPVAIDSTDRLVVPGSEADDFRTHAVATITTLVEAGLDVRPADLLEPIDGGIKACVAPDACAVFDGFELAADGRVESFSIDGRWVRTVIDEARGVDPVGIGAPDGAPSTTVGDGDGATPTTPAPELPASTTVPPPPSTEPSRPVIGPDVPATEPPAPPTTGAPATVAPPTTAAPVDTLPPATVPPTTARPAPTTTTQAPVDTTPSPDGGGAPSTSTSSTSSTSVAPTTTFVPPTTAAPTTTRPPTTTSPTTLPPTTTTTKPPATNLPDLFHRPFSATSPWNTRVGSAAALAGPGDTRTATLRGDVAPSTDRSAAVPVVTWVNAAAYSIPVFAASPSDRLVTLRDVGHGFEIQARVPADAVPAAGTDSNMAIVQPDGRTIDVWTARWVSPSVIECGRLEVTTLDGDGIGPQAGIRASGVSTLGGLIRRWEVDPSDPAYTDGVIRHALALSIPSGMLRYSGGTPGYDAAGYGTSLGYVWPATEQDWDAPYSYGGSVPMGTLVTIPRSVDLASLGLGREATEIARALQDYGGYVVDRAGDGTVAFYAEPTVPASWYNGVTGPAWTARDLSVIRRALVVVADNSPTSVGGGGSR